MVQTDQSLKNIYQENMNTIINMKIFKEYGDQPTNLLSNKSSASSHDRETLSLQEIIDRF